MQCPKWCINPVREDDSYRRIRQWKHEEVLERAQLRLDRKLDAMTLRRRTVKHVFGTLKPWMGSTHFLTKTLAHVRIEMMPARVGVQPQAGDTDSRSGEDDEGNAAGGT